MLVGLKKIIIIIIINNNNSWIITFFGFHKVKWLHLIGEVDNCVRFHVKFSQDLAYQKLLKSDNFWQSYSNNKKTDVFGTLCTDARCRTRSSSCSWGLHATWLLPAFGSCCCRAFWAFARRSTTQWNGEWWRADRLSCGFASQSTQNRRFRKASSEPGTIISTRFGTEEWWRNGSALPTVFISGWSSPCGPLPADTGGRPWKSVWYSWIRAWTFALPPKNYPTPDVCTPGSHHRTRLLWLGFGVTELRFRVMVGPIGLGLRLSGLGLRVRIRG